MNALWTSGDGMTAADLRDGLAARDLALTTVHTVLTRLEKKGFVSRDRSTRPHRYVPTSTREDHMVDMMTEVLDQASDRQAVLARFVGTVSESDTAFLSSLLGAQRAS